MRKHLPCFVLFFILILNLIPTKAFGLTSTNLANTITIANQENSTVTYVSSIEEYESAIKNPNLTTIEVLEDIDLSEMKSPHEIIIDGYDRIIDYRNREAKNYQEKPLLLNYRTNNSLNLRSRIGTTVNLLTSTLNENSITKNGDFEPKLYKTTSYGKTTNFDSQLFETVTVDNELLHIGDTNNNSTAFFYKGQEDNYYLELNNYVGEEIIFHKLVSNSTTHIILNGKNVIDTQSDFGIFAENTSLYFETKQETASLAINLNTMSETGIGIALDFNQPDNNSNLSIEEDIELEINIANQTPSDTPFLTGIFARHANINLAWSQKTTINIQPNFISDNIKTTNNITGIATELDGDVILLRNNIVINNEKGNYAIWTGQVLFPDGGVNLTTNSNFNALDNEKEIESKFIYKKDEQSGINNNHINSVNYNHTNYVERITTFENFLKSTLDQRITYLELTLCQETIDNFIEKEELNDRLTDFYNCFTNHTSDVAKLENLELFFNEKLNQYYLIINLAAKQRYAFKNNTKAIYTYKDYFRIEDNVENIFLLNYNQINDYKINSLDSISLYYPLNVIEHTPILLSRSIEETPENESANIEAKELNNPEEKTDTKQIELEAIDGNQNYNDETPDTSSEDFQSLYLVLLIVCSFGAIIVFNRRSDII